MGCGPTQPYKNGYGYKKRRDKESICRLITEITVEEMKAIDDWGIPAGMPSRTATVRHLLRKGLETERASGHVAKQSPDASESSE